VNKNLHKVALDVLPRGILILKEDLTVIMCNPSSQSLLLKPRTEIVGKNLLEIIPHNDLHNQARTVLRDRKAGTKLVELHLGPQEERILRATVAALDTEEITTSLCLIMLEDVTQQVQLEQQLVESEKLAGMGLLAQSIAHEVGNPLSIMASTLQYMQSILLKTGNRDFKEAIETIMDNLRRMHVLLRSLADFTGSKRPQFELCNLKQILSQLLTFIGQEAKIHNISIHREFDKNVPQCQVDNREIKQLFLNLLKNAIEAMPQGGKLRLKIRYLPQDSTKNKDRVLVRVSDTGIGIKQPDLQYIFRPFYSTKPKGTGLGLCFCQRVTEEHGGEISVRSQVGKGTSFTVILPLRQKREESA